MLSVKTESEFASSAYLYWQIIILVVNRHLEGHRTSHKMLLSLTPQLRSEQCMLSVVIMCIMCVCMCIICLYLHSFFPDD